MIFMYQFQPTHPPRPTTAPPPPAPPTGRRTNRGQPTTSPGPSLASGRHFEPANKRENECLCVTLLNQERGDISIKKYHQDSACCFVVAEGAPVHV